MVRQHLEQSKLETIIMATLINNINGVAVKVTATTEHSTSSYGQPVWVDEDNNAYCQVGMEAPFYTVTEDEDGDEQD